LTQCVQIQVAENDESERLDRFLVGQCPQFSRSRVQSLIDEQAVTVNGHPARSSYRVRDGDAVRLELPPTVPLVAVDPEDIPLDVCYEDPHLLVVNKAAGMVVHPAPGSWNGTLVNALLHHCTDLSGINGVLRPGIVHRLDRDTTGLLVVAKSDESHRGLAAQLEERTLQRCYTAVAWGHLDESGRIDQPIARHPRDRKKMAIVAGGRAAITTYSRIEEHAFATLLEVRLQTGRTHQIRVHLQDLGHPVFGDPVYGGRDGQVRGIKPELRPRARALLALLERQALHASSLSFRHPVSAETVRLEAPIPTDMQTLVDALRDPS
jgi:23S rRNA pseudouridine1911/1915/1917 synthase